MNSIWVQSEYTSGRVLSSTLGCEKATSNFCVPRHLTCFTKAISAWCQFVQTVSKWGKYFFLFCFHFGFCKMHFCLVSLSRFTGKQHYHYTPCQWKKKNPALWEHPDFIVLKQTCFWVENRCLQNDANVENHCLVATTFPKGTNEVYILFWGGCMHIERRPKNIYAYMLYLLSSPK